MAGSATSGRSFVEARPRYQYVKDIGEGARPPACVVHSCGSVYIGCKRAGAAFMSPRPRASSLNPFFNSPSTFDLTDSSHQLPGAFGCVFLAKDVETGQLVAIKEMVRGGECDCVEGGGGIGGGGGG